MRSRITTYMLVVAVIAVWGFVAWKIFFPRPTPPNVAITTSVERETGGVEEYNLRLDYKDPFLKDAPAGATSSSSSRSQESPPAEPFSPQPSELPDDLPLKYAGTISASGRVLYMFEHEGLLHPLSLGETLAGYTLTETFRDSVRVGKGGMVFTIQMKP